jgi:peptidoglycan/xylan/chitin deacetylase (PgdA/CDA1 family)
MTVTTSAFESHLQYLKDHGYAVIPLRHLVDHYLGKRPSLPARSLVITVDDGHKSVYTEMFPLLRKYHTPVTLFLYPSAISNASYAMTWNQLREIKETDLFDFQSHTFWHPNFKEERKRLKPAEYEDFVEKQLKKSRERLQREFNINPSTPQSEGQGLPSTRAQAEGLRVDPERRFSTPPSKTRLGAVERVKVDMLAWPFGIYDEWLIRKGIEAGYVAGFTMERRHASPSDNMMALPRYLLVGNNSIRTLLDGK